MARRDISPRLRARRLELGLSLSQLARKVGTSASALSRYENGWGRFELYTLRKIAAALGCRVRVELEPLAGEVVPDRASALRRLKRLFWDRRLRESDIDDYPQWVTCRVLEYGTLADVRALQRLFGRERFLAQVAVTRFESSRTESFWRTLLEREGISCTKRYSRREARPSWRG